MRALVLALCVAAALCIDLSEGFTTHQQEVLTQIKQTKWGSWIVDFAEVHLDSQGPLQDLLTGIDELIADLNEELGELVKNYARRTDVHNREGIRLQQEIDTSARDIFNGSDMVDNVLIPQIDRIQATLDQLAQNIADNRRNLDFETVQRNNENAAFQEHVGEHNDAIGAVDESLGLMSHLQSSSLIQVSKIQSNLQTLERNLNTHSTFGPLVQALLELATEGNFANQDAVKEIVTAFNNLRNELVASLNTLVADENTAQTTYNARVVQLNTENAEFQRLTLFRNAEITRTREKLDATR